MVFIFGVWLEDSFDLQIAALGAASAVIGLSELGGEGLVAAFVDRLGKPRAIGLGWRPTAWQRLPCFSWSGRRPAPWLACFSFTLRSSSPW